MARRVVAFYVSGHGFGHASRAIEVVNALAARRPDLHIIIRSSVAPWLVTRTARPGVELSPREVDTGIVQVDSLHLDAAASLERATQFMSTFAARVEAEAAFLRANDVTLTVSDLPPLGIASATAIGVPAVALGNFTWDWIYAHYQGGQALAASIGEIYQKTTRALRLPMWGGFETMPVVTDLPFVARRSRRDRDGVRDALGLPRDRRVVLTSFGGYGLEGLDASALQGMPGYHVLLPGMLDEDAMYGRGYRYEDLVRAMDVVVTKPGYGIISECLANQTALLYTSRGDFREYDVLVEAMPKFLRCAFIHHDDLYAGRWASHLDALLAQRDPPMRPPTDGADVAVDILVDLL
jgi:UDP:flavonoid glycosyltransferase YjiC (YdhE family)